MGHDQSKDGEPMPISAKNVMEVIQSFPSKNNELLRRYVDDSLKLGYLKITSVEQMEFVLRCLEEMENGGEMEEEKSKPIDMVENSKSESDSKILHLLDKISNTRDMQLRELQRNQDIMVYKLDELLAEKEKKQNPERHANKLKLALNAANLQKEKAIEEVEEYKKKMADLEAKLVEKQKEIREMQENHIKAQIAFNQDSDFKNQLLDGLEMKVKNLEELLAEKDAIIGVLEITQEELYRQMEHQNAMNEKQLQELVHRIARLEANIVRVEKGANITPESENEKIPTVKSSETLDNTESLNLPSSTGSSWSAVSSDDFEDPGTPK